jgi:hypothetical protein
MATNHEKAGVELFLETMCKLYKLDNMMVM